MPKTNPAEVLPKVAVHVLQAATVACAMAALLGACSASGKATHRIEPGDIVFRKWAYLAAFREEVSAAAKDTLRWLVAAGPMLMETTRSDFTDILFTHGRQKNVHGIFRSRFDQVFGKDGDAMKLIRAGLFSPEDYMTLRGEVVEMLQTRRAGIAATLSDPYAVSDEERRQLLRDNEQTTELRSQLAAHSDDIKGMLEEAVPANKQEAQGRARELTMARVNKTVASLRAKYLELGRIWEIQPGAEVNIEEYYDEAGDPTEPKVKGEWQYAADGNGLFAKISWGDKNGYMEISRIQ